jgi:hypothetical protein
LFARQIKWNGSCTLRRYKNIQPVLWRTCCESTLPSVAAGTKAGIKPKEAPVMHHIVICRGMRFKKQDLKRVKLKVDFDTRGTKTRHSQTCECKYIQRVTGF